MKAKAQKAKMSVQPSSIFRKASVPLHLRRVVPNRPASPTVCGVAYEVAELVSGFDASASMPHERHRY